MCAAGVAEPVLLRCAEMKELEDCAQVLRGVASSPGCPAQHGLTLLSLVRHLARLCLQSARNQLSPRGLAEGFSPLLFGISSAASWSVSHTSTHTQAHLHTRTHARTHWIVGVNCHDLHYLVTHTLIVALNGLSSALRLRTRWSRL